MQTIVLPREAKRAIQRDKETGSIHAYAATISHRATQQWLANDLLVMLSKQCELLAGRLIMTGKLAQEDLRGSEQTRKVLKNKGHA